MQTTRFSFLAILLVFIVLLVGCKPTDDESTTEGTTEPTTSGTTASTEPRDPLEPPMNFSWWTSDKRIRFVHKVADLTGENSINKTFTNYGFGRKGAGYTKDTLHGTDLGIPVYDEANEKMYLFFGDTVDINFWESNTVAFSTDFDLDDGILFDGMLMGGPRRAKAVIQGKHNQDIADGVDGKTPFDGREVTKIPTGGIVIDGAVYMHFMSIREWTNWNVNYNGTVKSTDGGQTWVRVPHLEWSETEAPNFGQVFPIQDKDNPDLVYLYGIPGGRDGAVKLARVLKENYEDMSKYDYFNGLDDNGEPIWVTGSEGLKAIKDNPASEIIDGPNGEFSVMYNEYLGQWFYTTLNPSGIVFRLSDTPWGEWSKPSTIVPPGRFNAGIYAPFVHEKYTTHDGQRIFMIMSLWTPYYNPILLEIVFR